jgi:hypothetical protein
VRFFGVLCSVFLARRHHRRLAVDAAKATLEKVDALLGELYDVPDFAAFAKSRAEAKKAKKKA